MFVRVEIVLPPLSALKWPRTSATCLGEAKGEDGSTVQGAAVNGEWPHDWMALPDAAKRREAGRAAFAAGRACGDAPSSRVAGLWRHMAC